MKTSKSFKGNKLTSISITFNTDEEIGCLEDIIILSERGVLNHEEHRNILPEILSLIKKEL